ncbi:MAG TPA: PDR/VanB family oxidoreductase [Xanthobacteraceae bacterium]|jgi:phthalate 4,5-dioxygenase reductase component|nr:PDR/VanB family oxidoreductase [Xanthobacteraceae bacterium]
MIPRRITRAERIAQDIHLFELRDPAGGELPAFTAGSHVSLRVPGGLLRKYSLCNDPAERDRYVIAVKREAGGRGGSESLIREAAVGHEIPVSAPVNNFALAKSPAGYLFVAGGIGITPIMAMMRELAASGGRFRLYYCTRSPEVTAFRDELAEFGRNVVIHHDGGDLARALDLWPILEKPKGQLYCCGPRGLMQAVRDMTGHWSPSAVHFEAFTDTAPRPDDTPFRVRLARSGQTIEVPVGTTILEALRAHGIEAPCSCESGTCGTCRTRLLAGEADHRDLVLGDEERETNIMVCVSRARSDELVIDR